MITNKAGFITFKSKNWGYKGDKGTWARVKGNQLTINRAAAGIMSSAYTQEITDFCEQFGINFGEIKPGERAIVTMEGV